MNYRKHYIDSLGINLNKHYEIHHIDRDRSNNDLSNLVAIPKDIHAKIHKIFNRYDKAIESINELGYFYAKEKDNILLAIKDYMNMKDELWPFIEKRNQLIINNKNG